MSNLLDDDCHHAEWAKERTSAGFLVCRICNPRPEQDESKYVFR